MSDKPDTWYQPIELHNEDGELIGFVERPTRDELLKHAEKFGTHMVAETAVQLGYELESLTELIERLDMFDAAYAKKHNRYWPKPKQSAAKRAERLLPKEEEEEVVA